MDDRQINGRLTELRKRKRDMEALRQEIEAIESEIKAEMERRGVDEIVTENYRAAWKLVAAVRLDARALKKERPELYERYAVRTESKRFTVT